MNVAGFRFLFVGMLGLCVVGCAHGVGGSSVPPTCSGGSSGNVSCTGGGTVSSAPPATPTPMSTSSWACTVTIVQSGESGSVGGTGLCGTGTAPAGAGTCQVTPPP